MFEFYFYCILNTILLYFLHTKKMQPWWAEETFFNNIKVPMWWKSSFYVAYMVLLICFKTNHV